MDENGAGGRSGTRSCLRIVGQSVRLGAGSGPNDAQIQADVTKALDNKRFKDVKAPCNNGVVTLTGTVDVYSDKEDADRRRIIARM